MSLPWHEHYVPGYGHMLLALPIGSSKHPYLPRRSHTQVPVTARGKAPRIHYLVRC